METDAIITVASLSLTIGIGLITAIREWKTAKTDGLGKAAEIYHQLVADLREEMARQEERYKEEITTQSESCIEKIRILDLEVKSLKEELKLIKEEELCSLKFQLRELKKSKEKK